MGGLFLRTLEDSKVQVGDQNPGPGPLHMMGVGPGAIEGSSRLTGSDVGVECVRPVHPLPPAWLPGGSLERSVSVSPKVALARVIHWVMPLGQQGGSRTTPAETSGPQQPVHPCGQDQTRPAGEGGPDGQEIWGGSPAGPGSQKRGLGLGCQQRD